MAVLIAMDHYGAFAGTTDSAKARKKIIETWWGLRQVWTLPEWAPSPDNIDVAIFTLR